MNDFPTDATPVNSPWTGQGVNTPTEVGNSVAGLIARTLPPIGAVAAGEGVGAALGGMAGEAIFPAGGGIPGADIGGVIGGALGGGAGNVVAKHLPTEIGGNPEQSNLSAFAWGAGPSGVASVLSALHALRATGKLDAATVKLLDEYDEQLAKQTKQVREALATHLNAGPRTAGDTAAILRSLGAKAQPYVAPADAIARRQATFPLRDAITGPIQRLSDRYGAPLGEAYKALKNVEQPISEDEAATLGEAASAISSSSLAPHSRAKATIEQLKRYSDLGYDKLEKVSKEDLAQMTPDERTFYQRQIERSGGQPEEEIKPPTLDQLRELRQVVNQQARTAQGGDRYALRRLQGAIDDQLVDFLPDNWSELRQNYKSFRTQFSDQSLNQLNRAADPMAVTKWLFGRPQRESFIREVVQNANDSERYLLRQGFDNFVLSGIDFNQPGEAQFKALQKKLQPYLQNGTLKQLFGANAVSEISNRIYLPMHAEALMKQLKTPAGSQIFDQGFQLAARQNPQLQPAVEEGFRKLIQSMPPEDQKYYLQLFRTPPRIDPATMGELPMPGVTPGEAAKRVLADKLKASASHSGGEHAMIARAGTYGVAGLAMGRLFALPFVASRVMVAGGGALNRALLRAATNTGMGEPLIRMVSEHPGMAGKYLYQLLGAIGAVSGSKLTNQPTDGEQVEIPQ